MNVQEVSTLLALISPISSVNLLRTVNHSVNQTHLYFLSNPVRTTLNLSTFPESIRNPQVS